jgi:hypothetical protein
MLLGALFNESFVDGESGSCAFRGCNDNKLHVPRCIARNIDAGDACRAVFGACNAAIRIKGAPKLARQPGAMMLARAEKQGVTWQQRAIFKDDTLQLFVPAFELHWHLLANRNAEL